jgi:hypothetical protein
MKSKAAIQMAAFIFASIFANQDKFVEGGLQVSTISAAITRIFSRSPVFTDLPRKRL